MAKQQYARVVLCVWLVCVAGVMLLVAPSDGEGGRVGKAGGEGGRVVAATTQAPEFANEFEALVSLRLHRPNVDGPYELVYNVTQSISKLAQVYMHSLNATTNIRSLARYDMKPPMLYVVFENDDGSTSCECSVSEYLVPVPELHAWRSTVPVVQRPNTTVDGEECSHFIQHGWLISSDKLSAFFSGDGDGAVDGKHDSETGAVPVHTVWRYPPIPEHPQKMLVEAKNFTSVRIGTPDDAVFAVPKLCAHCNSTSIFLSAGAGGTPMTPPPLQSLMSAALREHVSVSVSASPLQVE